MNKGIHVNTFNNLFSDDFELRYSEKIDILMKKGLIDKSDDSYFLTMLGMDVANKVFVEFI